MIEKNGKLITVLVFAVMLFILGLLVASVTSCNFSTGATALAAPTVVRPTPTWIPPDGTVYHPYDVDASSIAPGITWSVQIATKREQWKLNQLHTLNADDYIVYKDARYYIFAINRQALTMTVSGPLDCCAAS